jgi:hypothetical protein
MYRRFGEICLHLHSGIVKREEVGLSNKQEVRRQQSSCSPSGEPQVLSNNYSLCLVTLAARKFTRRCGAPEAVRLLW